MPFTADLTDHSIEFVVDPNEGGNQASLLRCIGDWVDEHPEAIVVESVSFPRSDRAVVVYATD